jgi:RimJ/RimL family protein N-acetyltransferase
MIRLQPATAEVARAVVHADGPLPVRRAADWPHSHSSDAFRSLADYPQAAGEGLFLVLDDDVVVGECGWIGPPTDGEVGIGYGLAPSARGQGTGTHAVRLLLTWVASQGATRVRAEVLPGNEASLRLLARLGFHPDGELGGHVQLLRALDAPLSP